MSRPRPPIVRFVVVLAAAWLMALAAPSLAGAASRAQILRDCEDDSRLSGTYTPAELRDARDNLGSDKSAYTDCNDVLRSALAASARPRATQSGANGDASGGTDAVAPGRSPADASAGDAPAAELNAQDTEAGGLTTPVASQDDLKELRTARENLPEVDIRGQRVVPGVEGVAGRAATATVPTSLVVVLVLLGVTAVLALVPPARRRVLARRAG